MSQDMTASARQPHSQNIVPLLYEAAQRQPGRNFSLPTPVGPALVLQDRKDVRRALRSSPELHKYMGAIQSFFGTSRLTSDEPVWRGLRDLSQKTIRDIGEAQVTAVSAKHYAPIVETLSKRTDCGVQIDLQPMVDLAAARTAFELIAGVDGDCIGGSEISRVRMVLRQLSQMNWGNAANGSSDPSDKLRSELRQIRTELGQHLSNAITSGPKTPFIAKLADLDEPIDEFVTILIAAYDTTATSILNTIYLLARAPAEQHHLHSVLAQDRHNGWEAQSPETGFAIVCAIEESLRMLPPVPYIGRVAVSDLRIGAQQVREGQIIILSIVGVNLNKHDDPKAFAFQPRGRIPDAAGSDSSTLAFSDGRRVCPGASIAYAEISAALSTLLAAMSFTAKSGPIGEMEMGISMRRREGYVLAAKPLVASKVEGL